MSALLRIMHGKNSLRGATGILIITLTLSNVLGLVRDRFLAAKIPADQLDSYFAAFRLPDLLTNLIVVGAIAIAFLPVFTELRTKDERQAWEAASAILNIMVVVLAVGSVLLWLLMPWLMPLVVPEFTGEKLAQTIALAQWLTLTPVIFGISYLLSGVLQSYQRFLVYSFAPLVYNLSIIVATVTLADRFGVAGVIAGVLAGAFLHMAIQLPVAARLGWRWRSVGDFQHQAVRRVAVLMGPRMIGLFGIQLIIIVATAIASRWPGSITYYNLATNIQTMPVVVFGNSIATALFPVLSLAAARQATGEFSLQLGRGVRWVLFLLIPASVSLILLRIQVVRLILGTGFFGWEATQTTADVLGWFALSIAAMGLLPLLARAFYARQNMVTPMTLALIASAVTITLSFWLAATLPDTVEVRPGYLLHVGQAASLAIAFSIGMMLNALLHLLALRQTLAREGRAIVSSVGRVILATLVMAAAVQLTKQILGAALDLDLALHLLIQTVVAIGVGIGAFVLSAWMLGSDEWHELKNLAKRKISTPTSTKPA